MIKINLLPPYVFEKVAIRRWVAVFGVLLVLVIAGGLGWRMNLNSTLASLNEQLSEAKIREQRVIDMQQKTVEELAKVGPVAGKVKFIEDVMYYNEEAPALYRELVKFTYEKILYRQINLTNAQMEIDAYAPSLSDAGRYLLNLYRASHIFSSVVMSAVPSYGGSQTGGAPGSAARPRGFDFKIICTLTQPLAPPAYGAGVAAGATQTPGAYPSQPMGGTSPSGARTGT